MLCAGIIFSATKLVLFISRCPLSTACIFKLFLGAVIIRKHGKHHIYVGFWTVDKFAVQFLHQGKRLVPLFPTGREQGYQTFSLMQELHGEFIHRPESNVYVMLSVFPYYDCPEKQLKYTGS